MKKVLALIRALVMALSLVACGKEKDPTADWGPEPEGTIEVEIWTLFGETLRNQYQKVIDDFNASQTKYHVTCETQGSAAELNAKLASVSQEELPAMFHGTVENVAMYANADYCVPLQEFIDMEKKGTWKELDNTWQAILTAYQDQSGSQIGYPQGYSYGNVFYNKDMFAKAGIVVDMICQSAPRGTAVDFSFTTSYDNFAAVMKALPAAAKANPPLVSGGYSKIGRAHV